MKSNQLGIPSTKTSMNFTSNVYLDSTCLESFVAHDNKLYESIIETGAIDHMIPHSQLLINKYTLNTPIHVTLLDSNTKNVSIVGSMRLS